MKVEDEPPVYFISEDGEEVAHDIKETLLLTGVEQCSDELYDTRKSICDSCDRLINGEMCEVDRKLIRIENRMQDKQCPLSKW